MIKSILFILVISVMVARGNWIQDSCGQYQCGVGQICVNVDGSANCVLLQDCTEVALIQTATESWVSGGQDYTIFTFTIYNYGDHHINQIYIRNNVLPQLRDSGSIWNIVFDGYTFSLPSYVSGIAPHTSHTFGFIVAGKTSPNCYIHAINYKGAIAPGIAHLVGI